TQEEKTKKYFRYAKCSHCDAGCSAFPNEGAIRRFLLVSTGLATGRARTSEQGDWQWHKSTKHTSPHRSGDSSS
uniref:hypothetical protein n=1 Tax=Pseudodesulfovibrio sp. TaxID=2035812 RepID=UPI00257F20CA